MPQDNLFQLLVVIYVHAGQYDINTIVFRSEI